MNTIIEGAIREAGRKLRDAYGTNARYREKERYHLMSDLDLEIDTFLTTRIRDAFPDDGVYSEERDELPSESGDRWIVDPIDGTAYFIFGVPFFSISVIVRSFTESRRVPLFRNRTIPATIVTRVIPSTAAKRSARCIRSSSVNVSLTFPSSATAFFLCFTSNQINPDFLLKNAQFATSFSPVWWRMLREFRNSSQSI